MNLQYKSMFIGVQTGLPVLLWGEPGIGKSSIVCALSVATKRHLETVICSTRDPSDLGLGLPTIVRGESGIPGLGQWVEYAPPGFALRILRESAQNKESILLLDELSQAAPAQQAAAMRVVLDREVGDHTLPETCWIIAAANPADIAAGGWDLAAPLANRFIHLDVSVDVGSWADGMVAGFPAPNVPVLPKGWRSLIPGKMAIVASFGRARPELVQRMPEGEQGRAWPSCRTWEYAAILSAACDSAGADDCRLPLLAGAVGEGPAVEFLEYERRMDLPDVNQEFLPPHGHPRNYQTPNRGDRASALWSSIGSAVLQDCTLDRWNAAMAMAEQAAEENAVDVAAPHVRQLLHSKPAGARISGNKALRAFAGVLKEASEAQK